MSFFKTSRSTPTSLPTNDANVVTATNANGDPTEIEFYVGGLSGTLVATMTITYDGSNNYVSSEITLA